MPVSRGCEQKPVMSCLMVHVLLDSGREVLQRRTVIVCSCENIPLSSPYNLGNLLPRSMFPFPPLISQSLSSFRELPPALCWGQWGSTGCEERANVWSWGMEVGGEGLGAAPAVADGSMRSSELRAVRHKFPLQPCPHAPDLPGHQNKCL